MPTKENSSKLIYARVLSEFGKGTPPKEALAVCRVMFENQLLADQNQGNYETCENAAGSERVW